MIDRKHAANEIGRLIGLNFFPTDQKALKELVTSLSFAATEIIATAVINEWLESQNQRPTPADLRRMVAAENVKHEERMEQARIVPIANCKRCGDCGLYGGQIGTAYDGPWKWCECDAADVRRNAAPGLVDEANEARQRLLARFGPKSLQAMIGERAKEAKIQPGSDYHGDF